MFAVAAGIVAVAGGAAGGGVVSLFRIRLRFRGYGKKGFSFGPGRGGQNQFPDQGAQRRGEFAVKALQKVWILCTTASFLHKSLIVVPLLNVVTSAPLYAMQCWR